MSKRRYGSGLAFNDLLFNVLIGFVILFVIAFLLINPITKKNEIPSRAEFLIILEWDDEAFDDVDLWVQRDNDKPVGFTRKEQAPLHLDRDDLGRMNDRIMVDGKVRELKINRETMTVRGIVPGDYYVTAHLYSKRNHNRTTEDLKVTVTVMKVSPYREVYAITETMVEMRSIKRFPAFTVDAEGNVTNVFEHAKRVVPIKGAPGDRL